MLLATFKFLHNSCTYCEYRVVPYDISTIKFQNQVDQKIADGIYALDERIQKVESSVGHDRARMKDIEKVG